MYLKRLELAGFKSFADKTELEFVQGITAVVGPNGSGKSNISDSIRWVLGEQSARSLRGGKMEDIIFAGSDSRKAVNYGEVSLTLDNSDEALSLDFHEVTVTRRIHRSGDSEYFINKQACRLRDITELFMDTGIGKEAYSIIGQGRIEEILSTRSEDRRGIFEEASGIVKYKSRKKEAEKKLAETEHNLLRIHDLVSELEDQLDPLKDQSEKAVQYKQLKEKLKVGEVSLYVHQIETIHKTWSEESAKLKELHNRELELNAVVSLHDAQLEKDRLAIRKLEDEIEQLHETILRLSEEYEKCEGQGEVLKERNSNLTRNRYQLDQTTRQQRARMDEKRTENAGYREKTSRLQQEIAALTETLVAEEDRLLGVAGGVSSAEEERLKAELLETLNRMAQYRNEIRYSDQHVESLERRLERMGEDEAKWATQSQELGAKRQSMEAEADQLAGRLDAGRNRYIALSQEQKAKQDLLAELTGTVRKWEQKIDALTSRRDTMREMQNDYDGFAHGVREVLKAKNRHDGLRGIHGAIAELVHVPAEVEIAIETALGGALQNIVVENEALGREAISFLKRRQLGRATFLPLDVIRGRSVPDHERGGLSQLNGYIGIAADLIRYDDLYRNIVGSLLGNVIVSKNLEDANRIAARCQYRYRVVTLEGDVVNPGGSMTGGSLQKKTTSLLSRQRQIEELEQEVKTSEAQLADLRGKYERLRRELDTGSKELETLREESERLRIEEQRVRSGLQALQGELKNAEDHLALYSQDLGSLAGEKADFSKKREQSVVALVEAEAQEVSLQQAIREAELSRKTKESAKEELQTQLTTLKVKIASSTQEKQSLDEQLERFEEDLANLQRECVTNERMLAQLDEDIRMNEQQTVLQIEQLNDLRLKKNQSTDAIEFKRAERTSGLQHLEREENKTREQRTLLKQVEDQIRQTDIRVNRLDVELESLLKKLAEDYEMSFELAKERYPVPEDIIGMQNEVRELKRRIASLGDVNLGAIEEYQRVKERYDFLFGQKQDLIEAKTTLYQVIREMNEEMSKRFRATFEAIRAQFVVVFAKLFGGGRADLILSDPTQLLDTGIEIVAQPPGKKLQNLQLLSGGERALTAMALLFAILRVKPVPFCVLDEVEAALDEANVTRFADYLREFAAETQFIVVTHRKGTMEAADVLYGVTMEEGGVSKLVSVRLEEDDAISA
ncbi:chromosome segregation protein SMC [Paenibacillus koleovorans]|uniref:chromosome segregation protein SMC n=1 Tax=Paenibacillus koleovorans TaxID=121608 RepID=UPI000FD88927|nr:chromosome segregation protein SMC [Paenibacillus koleovorans]